jgi:hypothetical protein
MRDLLPYYVNGTLPPEKRQAVEIWLQEHPEAQDDLAAWSALRSAVVQRKIVYPSADTLQRIYSRLSDTNKPVMTRYYAWLPRALGLAMMVVAVIALWLSVRPGVVLEWKVSGEVPSTFRVYRAMDYAGSYRLIREIAAEPGVEQYRFVDTLLIPGLNYSYRVEGVRQDNTLTASKSVSSSSLSVLFSIFAILLVSSMIGYAVILLMRIRFLDFPKTQYQQV